MVEGEEEVVEVEEEEQEQFELEGHLEHHPEPLHLWTKGGERGGGERYTAERIKTCINCLEYTLYL